MRTTAKGESWKGEVGWSQVKKIKDAQHSHISTFFIAHVHGPLRMSAELVNGIEHAVRVPSSGVLLYCTQETLRTQRDGGFRSELFSISSTFTLLFKYVRMKCRDSTNG